MMTLQYCQSAIECTAKAGLRQDEHLSRCRTNNHFDITIKLISREHTLENRCWDCCLFNRSSAYGRCSLAEQLRRSAVITWPDVGQSASSDINNCRAYSTAMAWLICIIKQIIDMMNKDVYINRTTLITNKRFSANCCWNHVKVGNRHFTQIR